MRTLAAGIGFTEGPLWTRSGRLLVTSMSRGLIYEVGQDGGAEPVAEPGGNPSGLAQDASGAIWIAQGGHHSPTRSAIEVQPCLQMWRSGRLSVALSGGLDAPNDCAIGPDGRVWFTDPRGEAFAGDGPLGRVCAFDPATGGMEVMAEGIRFPNGLAFAADRSALFVAETGTARILRFQVIDHHPAGARLGDGATHAKLPQGRPDGIAIDETGALYVAATTADAVVVIDREGEPTETIAVGAGSLPTNVCFGGEDRRCLFVTVAQGGRVVAVERGTAGIALPVGRT